MSKLLNKLILFFLPITLICFICELLLRNIPNDYKVKTEAYKKHAKDFKILALGESHAFAGINPIYFKYNTFNGSHVLQSLNYDLEILKKYQPLLHNIKYILLPISYGSFISRLENGTEKWRAKNYLIYYKIYNTNNIQYYFEFFSLPIKENISRIISFYFKNESAITTDSLGHGIYYLSEYKNDLYKTGEIAALLHTDKKLNNWAENISSLCKIIEICKDNNITVILYTPPAYSTYRTHLDPFQLNKTIESAQYFCKKNSNVYYFNFLVDTFFTANHFYDANHLNDKGAKLLSIKLNSLINRIESLSIKN
jgi:hypothetical protein